MSESAGRTILLVEDESIIAMAEAVMLKRNGYAVRTAYSGSSAIDSACSDENIDLVLMDLDLGQGMDGAEAAERILNARSLPVLFLSSHTEQEVVERTERIASYGYVVKNSGERVLLASIKMAFRLYEARMRYQAKAAELEEALVEGRRFEAALAEKEAELRSLFDAVPAGIGILDERAFRKVNAAMVETFGYTEGEMLGRTTRMLYCDDAEYERVGRDLYAALKSSKNARIETRLCKKDGSVLDIMVVASAMDPSPGSPRGLLATVLIDMTEKRRAREILSSKETLLAELFRACPESISLSTLEDGRFIEVNDAACRMFGYAMEEIVGKTVEELGLWCSPGDRAAAVERLKRGDLVRNFETKLRRKDGTILYALMSMTTFVAGGRACLLGFVTDIGERKRMEAALSDSLKEEEALLHELQHRIKNGLAMIASMIQLEAGRAEEPRMAEVLGNLAGRVDSMSALYDLFARSGSSGSVVLGIYLGAIVDALADTRSGSDGRISIEARFAEATVDVKSALSWGLIVNELVTNAFKYAFPPGSSGSVVVELRETPESMELSVRDDGVGLPPGFETEKSGGLGFDIVRMMALQLRGSFSAISEGGASFLVKAPRPRP